MELTARQQQVLGLWLSGYRYKELAATLGLSPETVNPHLKAIAKKLGAKGISRAKLWEVQPHSRACGARKHQHGTACHVNCPSCAGTLGYVGA